MKHSEKSQRIANIIADQQLDALVLGNLYNVQYATGVQIPAAHAQTDLVMLALFKADQEATLFVPQCWETVARQQCYFANVVAYALDVAPLAAAVAAVVGYCQQTMRIGLDGDVMSVATVAALRQGLEPSGAQLVPCADAIATSRAIKTDVEIDILSEIAYKTDHVINGHFHHLSADRRRTATLISESLRVHSLERDIEIAGYNACSRAVLGQSLAAIWAYAPKYGFADAEMTQENDAIIADVINCEEGYWSNATRIAISNDQMSTDQEEAYSALCQMRHILLTALRLGQKGADVYTEAVAAARAAEIPLVESLRLGFCVGVSAMEGPYLSAGEAQTIQRSMVLVLDPVVAHKGLLYRSRDTVVMQASGPEIVNWYKDWREPYLAILEL